MTSSNTSVALGQKRAENDLALCRDCAHMRAPAAMPDDAGESAPSPGRVRAATEALRLMQARQDRELARVKSNYVFTHAPAFHAWCVAATPTGAQLKAIMDAQSAGDAEALKTLCADKMEWVIDPVRGEAQAVFALCSRRNPQGRCKDYEPRDSKAVR